MTDDPNFVPARPRQPGDEPQVLPAMISKDDIWRRATEDEAVQMEAALQQVSPRLHEIYNGATFISPDDELFAVLQGALVQLFGQERAAELLARSN